MNIKNNKKAQESKEKIQASLCMLLKEKGHQYLNIKEICQTAGVNRSTFYAHFDSIEDVFYQICEENILKVYTAFLDTSLTYKQRVKKGIEIMKDKLEFFAYIFSNVHNFEMRVIEMIENSWVGIKAQKDYEKAKLSLAFIISGFIGIGKTYFKDYLQGKAGKISSEEFAELISNLVNENNPYLIIE